MRYHYSSPYENDPDSPYDRKPDSPETNEDDESADPAETAPQAAPPPTPSAGGAKWSRWRLPLAGVVMLLIVAIILGFLLHAASTGSPTTRAATATPVPKVLYSADWSHGDAGWTLPAHWSLVKGQIENDGYGTAPLVIPYEVTQPNYTIAVDFTVTSIPAYRACHSYGIEGLSSGNTLQFLGDVNCITKLTAAYHAFSETYVAHADSPADQLSTNDYTVQFYTQTFTVQVQRNDNVDFCPANDCLANRNSTTPLSPLQIAIYCVAVRLAVSRIVITTP